MFNIHEENTEIKNTDNIDKVAYDKIDDFYYGKSCSPLIYSENILFLGVGSLIEITIFNKTNPNSTIYLYGFSEEDKNKINNKIDNINFLENDDFLKTYKSFDSVKINKGFLNKKKNREIFSQIKANKIYGDFNSIEIPPLELHLLLRKNSNIFFLVDEDQSITISGYKKKEKVADVAIVISVTEFNQQLTNTLNSIIENSELQIELILSPVNNILTNHNFVDSNKISVITEVSNNYYEAWHKGFNYSNSDYILFMHSVDGLSKHIVEELYLLAVSTHAEIIQSGYSSHQDHISHNETSTYNLEKYGIVKNPKQFLKVDVSPWRRLYQSKFIRNLHFNDSLFFQETVLNFLTISLVNNFALLPDNYYSKKNENTELSFEEQIAITEKMYVYLRPHASMEVMNYLLEYEIDIYNKFLLSQQNDKENHYNNIIDKLSSRYGDKYIFREKIIDIR